MRQFFWGLVFGASCAYFWTYYGDNVVGFANYTLQWREGAVRDTKGFGVSKDADTTKRHNR